MVSTISLHEVFKRVLVQRGEDAALQVVAQMQQGRIVALDPSRTLRAANLSTALKRAMADSMMLTTARQYGAVLWTKDEDRDGLEGMRFQVNETT